MDLTQLRLRLPFDDFEDWEPRLSNQTEQTLSGDSGSTRKEIETKRKRKKNEKKAPMTSPSRLIDLFTLPFLQLFYFSQLKNIF